MASRAVLGERAAPKVNLTLEVLGRRSDGYHELSSLVAFASGGDRLTLRVGEPDALELTGPWALALASDGARNLVLRALDAVRNVAPGACAGTFCLEKNLPVASGIGGGSSDAAAALRLLRRANPEIAGSIDWLALAASLGADVPVCLEGRTAMMSGIGHRVTTLGSLPPLAILLVNPAVPLSTAEVFRSLAAPPCPQESHTPPAMPPFADRAGFLAYLRSGRNDLEPPARRLCPAIGAVLCELASLDGIALARMSGSGPTCFGLFEAVDDAEAAAASLFRRRPDWWVQAGRLL